MMNTNFPTSESVNRDPLANVTNGAQIVGGSADSSGPGPQLMLADTLTGNDVVNAQTEKLGDIKGIMLDVVRGQIAYGVLAVGGFMGMGEKLFAIPWNAFKLDAENKQFVLDVSKEKLQDAPGFDKDNWPSMADSTWANQVHSYYGKQQYWQ
jgi:hypothetical protein